MKAIVKVEITIGEYQYNDFVLADGKGQKEIQQAIGESLWEDPLWLDDVECEWLGGEIHCLIDEVTPVKNEELVVLKKFGVL